MVALGGNGRDLTGLLTGSALSAAAGLLVVGWMTRTTRLSEDAAIGAVLSVFFGFGIVLLTVIQTMSGGRQAGLESFLLGSTAGMLFNDALIITIGGALTVAATFLLRRPMTLVAFDPDYAAARGVDVVILWLMATAAAYVVGTSLLPLPARATSPDRSRPAVLTAFRERGLVLALAALVIGGVRDLPTVATTAYRKCVVV